jgi:glycosyltransferase involved in cell wall biosynthesis
MIRTSVVIPTHNRASGLRSVLERALAEAAACDAEVVVVDNASTDGTAGVLSEVAAGGGGRLRAVGEPVAGASRARNAGVRAARGALVAFCDDDALPRPGWLAALVAAFAADTVAYVGGRVVLDFGRAGAPAWLTPTLAAYLAAYDLGPTPLDLGDRERGDAPRGLNMAVRRDPFLAVGGFALGLGPRAGRPSVGEESELSARLLARGHRVRYEPAAVVEHLIDPDRLDARWFLRRAFWTGWAEAAIDAQHRRLWTIGGRLRWHYGAQALRVPRRLAGPLDGQRLTRQCERREAWGYLLGLLRHLPARGRGAAHLRALRRRAAAAMET